MGKTFCDINHSNVFLGQSPMSLEIKAKTNKRELIKAYELLQRKREHK